MPELSRFYGITIRMYFDEKEHNPPHIHAKYGSMAATFNISDGSILSGDLPPNAKCLVKEWVLLHSSEIEKSGKRRNSRRLNLWSKIWTDLFFI